MINKYHVSTNLFDNSEEPLKWAIKINTNQITTNAPVCSSTYIKCKPNTTYTITKPVGHTFIAGYTKELPADGVDVFGIIGDIQTGTMYSLKITTGDEAKYLFVNYRNANFENPTLPEILAKMKINEGSTALPYEPYGNTWNPIPYRQYHLNPTSITSSEITTNGGNLNSLTISGNTIQNGTPSPTNIIYPIECGDSTKNLYNANATDTNNGYIAGYFLNSSGSTYTPDSAASACITEYIPIESNQTYSQSDFYVGSSGTPSMCFYDNNKTFIEGISVLNNATFTTPINASFIRFSRNTTNTTSMFNIGSNTIPYEPYGYKIPITINSNTYNIYLNEPIRKIGNYSDTINNDGSVTRYIQKKIYKGTESWGRSGTTGVLYSLLSDSYYEGAIITLLCSHYPSQKNVANGTQIEESKACIVSNYYISIRDNNYTSYNDFKTYLQQQYNNNTPMTIWYVLNTPTTEQITLPTIPTMLGQNTFTVDTTLQPSDVKIADWWENKGYGKYYDEQRWINALYGKYSVGYWENFTISEMEQKTINQLQGG